MSPYQVVQAEHSLAHCLKIIIVVRRLTSDVRGTWTYPAWVLQVTQASENNRIVGSPQTCLLNGVVVSHKPLSWCPGGSRALRGSSFVTSSPRLCTIPKDVAPLWQFRYGAITCWYVAESASSARGCRMGFLVAGRDDNCSVGRATD